MPSSVTSSPLTARMVLNAFRLGRYGPPFLLAMLLLLLALSLPPLATTMPLNIAKQTPRIARIALLHMHDNISFFRRLGKLTGDNKRRYAHRHGYDMVFSTPYNTSGIFKPTSCDGSAGTIVSGPDHEGKCWTDDSTFDIDHKRAATFGKVRLALAACRGRHNAWLFWSDADALIINQTVRLETVIDDAYDIILAYDWLMLNAGMLFIKCSPWAISFMNSVYDARKFDKARALDQSSLQEHLDNLTVADRRAHLKVIPKYAMNVYTEEYRPGDFLMHFAGKLYEATEPGLFAIANQFDILSTVDDVEDIAAFFHGTHLLNYYSGTCDMTRPGSSECPPTDPRRITLHEPLGAMSHPRRYRHVHLRYYWLDNWQDKYDVTGWDKFLRPLASNTSAAAQHPPEPPAARHEQAPILPPAPPQAKHQAEKNSGKQLPGEADLPAAALHHPHLSNPVSNEVLKEQAKENAPEVNHDFDGADHIKGQPDGDQDDPTEDELEAGSSWSFGWVVVGAVGVGAVAVFMVLGKRRKVQAKKQ